MGAWGTGPLDNDAALDWLARVRRAEDPRVVLMEALTLPDDDLDVPDGDEAVAAAFLVAVAAGLDAAAHDGEGARDVVAAHHPFPQDAGLRAAVGVALDRVLSPTSDYRAVWEDEGRLQELRRHHDAIRGALGLPLPPAV